MIIRVVDVFGERESSGQGGNQGELEGALLCLSIMSDGTVKCFISALKTKARVSARCTVSSPQGLLVDDLDSSK